MNLVDFDYDYIVVGSPITKSDDMLESLNKIIKEITS